MSKIATTVEGRNLTIQRDGLTLVVDVFDVCDSLDDAAKMQIAEALTWGPVLAEACRRLADRSTSWSGDDWETREAFLIDLGERTDTDAKRYHDLWIGQLGNVNEARHRAEDIRRQMLSGSEPLTEDQRTILDQLLRLDRPHKTESAALALCQ